MKRLLILVIAVVSTIAIAMAQNPLATLSHNGRLSFFSNQHALQSAYDKAVSGDTIFLSEGSYSTIKIGKNISIIGSGYKSKIIDMSIYFDVRDKGNGIVDLDGVKIGTMDIGGYDLKKLQIKNSDIQTFKGYLISETITIDKCHINEWSFTGKYAEVYLVSNCKINTVNNSEFAYTTTINCNIGKTSTFPRLIYNCIINNVSNNAPGISGTTSIYNTLMRSRYVESNKNADTENCYYETSGIDLLDENMNCTLDLKAKGYLGTDGTIIGAYGGGSPFSENPSVLTVDSSASSVVYDAENCVLDVNIKMKGN